MCRYSRLLVIILLAWLLQAGLGLAAEGRPVYVLPAVGSINPGLAEFILNGIQEAENHKAEALVIELDTPGGLDSSMRQIVQAISNARVPVIVYVYPKGARAASAGVFITEAAEVAAMAPGTNIGAAHPVSVGMGKMDKTMEKKVLNDMVAYGRALAIERGRNADWMEKAVRQSVSISRQRGREAQGRGPDGRQPGRPADQGQRPAGTMVHGQALGPQDRRGAGSRDRRGSAHPAAEIYRRPQRRLYPDDDRPGRALLRDWPTPGWCCPGWSEPSACSWPFSPSRPCPSIISASS